MYGGWSFRWNIPQRDFTFAQAFASTFASSVSFNLFPSVSTQPLLKTVVKMATAGPSNGKPAPLVGKNADADGYEMPW